jgi:hypothetical protein
VNNMNAQILISHRMFVAALSHDESQSSRPRANGPASASPARRASRSGNAGAPEAPGPGAQQLFLLSEVAEFQPASA